ncbi:MAG: NAD+ synthase [Planctomycetes bacterium]|nr:NAD+ synthase [Planctomycetota bacterium]
MRIALAQINTTVGDFAGNVARILAASRGVDADLVLLPELAICGYMPRDLLLEPSFLDACERALGEIARAPGPPLLLGTVMRAKGPGKPLLNVAVLVRGGKSEIAAEKRLLPTYDVFDERRYFRPGAMRPPATIAGKRVGVTICEDMWTGDLYEEDPVADLARAGANVIVNLSASPYEQGKPARRRTLVAEHAARHKVPFAFCNLVGANDQLIFDGNSFVIDAKGALTAHAKGFAEETVVDGGAGPADDVKDALVLGIRDYLRKTGFEKAILGMSGGVDSSLVACLAAEALGPANVTGVGMPGPFNAPYSLTDAQELARRTGIRFLTVPITRAYDLLREEMRGGFGGRPEDVTEENLQARLRGTILMSLANKWGALVLVPSNKSEFAMGYCTMYGDMVGALAPISDLYKRQVYELARRYPAIPERVLTRAPSAELRRDQTDQDTLPPYDVLDAILHAHVEERLRPDEIVARGFDPEVVRRVLRTVSAMEFKRQQAAPVLKVTAKAFGWGGRRFPIVERFRGGA